jgi:hypothetical protein
VWLEWKEPQPLIAAGKDFHDAFLVVFRKSRNRHVLQVDQMLPMERTAGPGSGQNNVYLVVGLDRNEIDISRYARKAVYDHDDKTSEAIESDFFIEDQVEIVEKRMPRFRRPFHSQYLIC